MLAAGHVANRIFLIGDSIEAVCAGAAGLTLALALMARRLSPFRVAAALRMLGMLIAFGTLTYQLGSLRPEMQRNLHSYWLAAEEGRNGEAEQYRLQFRELHPKASRALAVGGGAVLVALAAAAWSLATPTRPAPPLRLPEYGDE